MYNLFRNVGKSWRRADSERVLIPGSALAVVAGPTPCAAGPFLPREGGVLFQMAVGSQENETLADRRIVHTLDLRGKIITGDALLAQRELSLEIVKGGGE